MSQYQQGPQYQQQPPMGWQPPPPPKKSHTLRNVLIVLGSLAVVGLGGCVAIVGSVGNELNKTHSVTYRVTGTSTASMTYTTDNSGSGEQASDERLPWSRTFDIKGSTLLYQVLAQNEGAGTVTCAIEVDGTVVKTATASGQGAIAHCSYNPSS